MTFILALVAALLTLLFFFVGICVLSSVLMTALGFRAELPDISASTADLDMKDRYPKKP